MRPSNGQQWLQWLLPTACHLWQQLPDVATLHRRHIHATVCKCLCFLRGNTALQNSPTSSEGTPYLRKCLTSRPTRKLAVLCGPKRNLFWLPVRGHRWSHELLEMEWKQATLSLCHTSDWCNRYAIMTAWGRFQRPKRKMRARLLFKSRGLFWLMGVLSYKKDFWEISACVVLHESFSFHKRNSFKG